MINHLLYPLLSFLSVISDFFLELTDLTLLPIKERRFYFASQIYSIYYLRGIPLVYFRRARLPSPMIPSKTKIVMTLILFLSRQPRYIGLDADAKVPTADTIPAPIPLALAGQSSQKQTWKKIKKNEMQPLNTKTKISSKMAQQLRSWSYGFLMKVISSAHRTVIANIIIPIFLLYILQMKRYEGTYVTNSERLTIILLMYMLKPMLSMRRLGPQYIA